ncbi:hypothetical protein [Mucilaginibacter jinjuensis]|uniref:Uncharacterized protein n=1 Tax=Mucilaginibacter jinjuensis TaxID=1176721 RepID=A0ABY7TAH0_9SPHI|nr:hypothetical protein [Mucilaginibacter jinjuensis]WCT13500.1 hypothetical protein PQO05_06070 [Mucilaginibacter jinjuensis]
MIKLSREEIYQMVWEQPMIDIAKKYVVSDVGFRKICLRMNIPIPRVGHWAKMRAGYKERRPGLPLKTKGETFIYLEERPPDQAVKKASKYLKLTKELSVEKLPFKVPDRLTNPDPLILAAKESLGKKKDINYPGMAVTGKRQLDIRVSPVFVGRALRFMDTLIKCVRARGYRYETLDDGNYVVIRDVKLRVCFRELTTKYEVNNQPYQNFEWRPNGVIAFRLDGRPRSEWKDLKNQLLEDQLPKVLAKLELAARQKEEEEEKTRLWQQNWELRRKEEAERQMRKAKELKDFKKLVKDARRWQTAQLIRNYIAVNTEADGEWIDWANRKADWIDPKMIFKDEWLSEIDKDSI